MAFLLSGSRDISDDSKASRTERDCAREVSGETNRLGRDDKEGGRERGRCIEDRAHAAEEINY